MTTINSGASDYIDVVQKAIKRNTMIEVIDAKQSGTPINKDDIQASNQVIKDKSVDVGIAVYQTNLQKQTLDTYVQISQESQDFYTSSSQNDNKTNEQQVNSFDAQAVNDARSTVQKRAAGIAIYENIQSGKSEF